MKIAATLYNTVQVAEDSWKYEPIGTYVFDESAPFSEVIQWAKGRRGPPDREVPMGDLVFTKAEFND